MSKLPKITISELDLVRLEALLDKMPKATNPNIEALEEELARASVKTPEKMPKNVVTMNSEVKFKVSDSQESFVLKLVYPKDLDDSGKTISILAPVGSAMLGLKEGDTIEWPKPGGGIMKVTVDEVVSQPEREGIYHI
ncbi:nucleoside diphosphate kinase regulator [Kangiella spongicola]|jgi:regulator of nucleoside diphosphate kinase|uniref:Nucleoside diphosphate kinase regulator n=1 Tax=Kangiella spongicola TaxID=796379 RepID=A0A318D3I5_9GAMM|nr:nucleoside diphosphate kinase regulator [Kangiella spongicola]MBV34629.1 nucleoside diphosphate kinase regulator [Rickettsiales bacterium]PXF63872.1 nucleoside diphosphate kinase regulator [Kangiella spongicola]